MIRKLLMSTVTFVAIGGTAYAADLPARRAPPVFVPPPIPVFSWTGFYVGGQVGVAFGETTVAVAPIGLRYNAGQPTGTIGGGHIGYNFSTQSLPILSNIVGILPGFGSAGVVIGVEGDVDGTDYRSQQVVGTLTQTFRNQIGGSARGRLGFAVDRALFYVTGGAAFAQFQDTFTNTTNGVFQNPTNTRVGFTVGGGFEYALTTHLSLRAEYRFTEFGRYNDQSATLFAPVVVTATEHVYMNRVQVGFSYKFDNPAAPAPVVARY